MGLDNSGVVIDRVSIVAVDVRSIVVDNHCEGYLDGSEEKHEAHLLAKGSHVPQQHPADAEQDRDRVASYRL